MHATIIVGYTYRADNYCPPCIVEQLRAGGFTKIAPTSIGVDQELDNVAERFDIDRTDERSFDSGDFPKVIFGNQVHDGCHAANGYEPGQCADRCGGCGEHLRGSCPNVAE